MFSATTLVLVFAMLQGSASVFGDPLRSVRGINTGLEGWQKTHCWQLRRSSANVQFPWYCKPGGISVISVYAGFGWVNTRNLLSFTGKVQQDADVHFITEQDGTGQILAKFNGVILSCQGLPAHKRKLCKISSSLRPWSGTIILQITSSHVSTRFAIHGKLDVPKILSPSKTFTVMFLHTVTLPCRYTASGPVIVKWIINNKLIAIKQLDGAKQTGSPRLTLHDNGDLSIKNVTYGDAGKFFCVVQNVKFGDYVSHILNVESKPLMAVQFLVNGNQTTSHVYRVGDNVIINCHVIAIPVPSVTWSYGQQIITTTAKTKVILSKHPNFPAFLQLQLRIMGVTQADGGIYSCTAKNSHGVTTKSIKVTVTQ